jgi:hypothetical protein
MEERIVQVSAISPTRAAPPALLLLLLRITPVRLEAVQLLGRSARSC